jgi:hypothetical protein
MSELYCFEINLLKKEISYVGPDNNQAYPLLDFYDWVNDWAKAMGLKSPLTETADTHIFQLDDTYTLAEDVMSHLGDGSLLHRGDTWLGRVDFNPIHEVSNEPWNSTLIADPDYTEDPYVLDRRSLLADHTQRYQMRLPASVRSAMGFTPNVLNLTDIYYDDHE